MPTVATIKLSEVVEDDGRVREFMEIDYEVERDEEGNIILRSNVIGMSRIVFELFRAGILERFCHVFVPANPDLVPATGLETPPVA